MITDQQNLAIKTGTATIGRIVGRSAGYLTQIILARALSPDGFGLFAIGWTLLRLFSTAGHLGLDSGVIKFGGQFQQEDGNRLRNVVILSLGGAFLSGVATGVFLYFAAPWLAENVFRKPELIWVFRGFAVAFPFVALLRVAAATSSLSGNMLCGAISEDIAQPFIQIGLFIYLYNLGTGLEAAVVAVCISYVLSVGVSLFCVMRSISRVFSFEKISAKELIPILKFSLPAIAGITLGAFNLWGDRLLVGYFSTGSSTGIYQSISVLTMITTIILSGFKISIAPMISHLYHARELNTIISLTRSFTRWALYLSLPVLMFVFVSADALIVNLFGLEYRDGKVPLIILTVGQVFYVIFGISDQVFLMTGRQKDWVKISTLVFFLTILFDAILIPVADLIGASITSCLMMLLLGTLAAMRLKHIYNFSLLDIHHLRLIATAVIVTLVTYPFVIRLPFGFLLNSLVTFTIIGSMFVLGVWITGVERSDKELFRQLLKRLAPH